MTNIQYREINIKGLGYLAPGDGQSHKISDYFPNVTLQEVKALHWNATLEDEADWYVIQKILSNNTDINKKIIIPAGTYLISQELYMSVIDILEGENFYNSKFKCVNAEMPSILLIGNKRNSDGSLTAFNGTNGINGFPTIRKLFFEESYGGIIGIEIISRAGFIIDECWFITDTCIHINNCSDSWIKNCQMDNNCSHFIIMEGDGSDSSSTQSIIIDKCNMFKSQYAGIKIDGCSDIIISNCVFNFIKQFSIYTGSTLKNSRINIYGCNFKASNIYLGLNQQHVHVVSPTNSFNICNSNFSYSEDSEIAGTNINIKNCTFSNSKNYAVKGTGNTIILQNSEFYNIGGTPVYSNAKILADNNYFENVFINGLPTDNFRKACIVCDNAIGNSSNSKVSNSETVDNTCAVFSAIGTYNNVSKANKSAWTYDSYFYVDNFNTSLNEHGVNPVNPLKLIHGIQNGKRIFYGTTTPTTGSYNIGDRLINTPTVGQPKSWICTVAGTPGTWVSEGNL